jgi:hypothetical protein
VIGSADVHVPNFHVACNSAYFLPRFLVTSRIYFCTSEIHGASNAKGFTPKSYALLGIYLAGSAERPLRSTLQTDGVEDPKLSSSQIPIQLDLLE